MSLRDARSPRMKILFAKMRWYPTSQPSFVISVPLNPLVLVPNIVTVKQTNPLFSSRWSFGSLLTFVSTTLLLLVEVPFLSPVRDPIPLQSQSRSSLSLAFSLPPSLPPSGQNPVPLPGVSVRPGYPLPNLVPPCIPSPTYTTTI